MESHLILLFALLTIFAATSFAEHQFYQEEEFLTRERRDADPDPQRAHRPHHAGGGAYGPSSGAYGPGAYGPGSGPYGPGAGAYGPGYGVDGGYNHNKYPGAHGHHNGFGAHGHHSQYGHNPYGHGGGATYGHSQAYGGAGGFGGPRG